MKHTMRIITLLLLTMVGTGQAWADSETVGHITYSKGADDHGTLTFHGDGSNANSSATPITVGADLTPSSYYSATTINEAVKDDNNNIIGYKVYIHAVPDFGYALGNTNVDNNDPVSFIQAEVVTQVQQAPGRRTVEVGEKVEVYKYNNGVYYFTLPADPALSVRVTASFPVKAKNTEAISYIGTDGTQQTLPANTVYVIDGTEGDNPTLGNPEANSTTWYVLNFNASYCFINLAGKVNLILANGNRMDVGGSFYGTADGSGSGTPHSLAIYGQSRQYVTQGNPTANDCGQINLSGEGFYNFDNLAIYGGHIVSNDGSIAGINTLTMAGGKVEWNSYNTDAINVTTFNYTGGQFALNSGISAAVTIGWSRADDYFQAASYSNGLTIATGQRFVAFNAATGTAATTIVSGTVADVTTLAGKTLKPLEGNYVSINSVDFDFTGTTSTTSPFTITTGEGENTTTTHYYIYKENNTATLSYTGNDFVQVTGLPEGTTLAAVENQPMKRTFTMPATDVELTATAVTGLTATAVTYDGTARTPEIKQGDDVFAPENYTIDYKLGDEAVTAADVKNAGTYTCTLTGLGQYIGITTMPFDITLRSTNIAVEIVNSETTVDGNPVLIAGDDAHVKVTLVPVKGENETTELPAMNGIVTISVDNGTYYPKSYNVAIVNGVGHYYVANLAQDAYAITASFAGDDNHAASTTENATTLEVCMIPTELDISLDKTEIYVGETATVSITLNQSINAVVSIRINSQNSEGTSVPLVNGKGAYELIGFAEGTYVIDVDYAGDDIKYVKSGTQGIKTLTLTVSKQATSVSVSTNSPVIAKEQVYD